MRSHRYIVTRNRLAWYLWKRKLKPGPVATALCASSSGPSWPAQTPARPDIGHPGTLIFADLGWVKSLPVETNKPVPACLLFPCRTKAAPSRRASRLPLRSHSSRAGRMDHRVAAHTWKLPPTLHVGASADGVRRQNPSARSGGRNARICTGWRAARAASPLHSSLPVFTHSGIYLTKLFTYNCNDAKDHLRA
jgi:hypothetical protein